MSLEEVSERLNRLAEAIAENIPALTQEAAITAKTKIQERIQESGLNEELVSFPAYNPQYKKRKAKLQGESATSFRNLTLSGAMWRQTGIKSQGDNGGRYEVVIGGLNQEAQDKINWNSEQLGDILKISEDEEKVLKEDYEAGLDELISQSGLK